MRFEGTVIEEDGLEFGILVVQESTIRVPSQATEMQNFGVRVFGDIPVVLMARTSQGAPVFHGPQELVDFVTKKEPSSLSLTWFDV